MTNSNKHAREFGDSVWDDMYTSCKREEISVSQRNNFKQLYECSFIPDEHIQSNKEKIIDCVNAGRRCGKTETHFNMISNPSGNNHYYSLFKNVNENDFTSFRFNYSLFKKGENMNSGNNRSFTNRAIIQIFVFDQDSKVPDEDSLVYRSKEIIIGERSEEDAMFLFFEEFKTAVDKHNNDVRKKLDLGPKGKLYSNFNVRTERIV